jgi:hypothetical protein
MLTVLVSFVCGFDDGMVLSVRMSAVMLVLGMIDNEEIGIAAGALMVKRFVSGARVRPREWWAWQYVFIDCPPSQTILDMFSTQPDKGFLLYSFRYSSHGPANDHAPPMTLSRLDTRLSDTVSRSK